jgi:hypothetical protein
MVLSIVVIVLVRLSYLDEKKYIHLIREALFIYIVRNLIRCFDLENTLPSYSPQYWAFLVNQQSIICFFLLSLYFKSFSLADRVTVIQGAFMVIMSLVSFNYGQYLPNLAEMNIGLTVF